MLPMPWNWTFRLAGALRKKPSRISSKPCAVPKLSPVSYKQLVKVFEAEGFRCVRAEGDHMVFTKTGNMRPVVIPNTLPSQYSSSRTT